MTDYTATSHRPKIVLATANPGKIREMKDLLSNLDVTILSIQDFEAPPVVREDRPDLEGNAAKKAQVWHEHTGLLAVADDTGLEVPFLNGAPGVYSSRYAGEDGNAEANMSRLLQEMTDATGSNRKAQFRTIVSIVGEDVIQSFEGIAAGRIATRRSGTDGFGYDPIFIPDGYQCSFAELSVEEKNEISHRGMAVRAAARFLQQLFQ